MSTKIRALLWEELRTGGVIAGWCVLVGMSCLMGIRAYDAGWQLNDTAAMLISLGSVLLLTVLVMARTGNSGQLRTGFSERILLLPMDTWRMVGFILLFRTTLILGAAVLMIGACHLLFGEGPVWIFVLLLPALYLAWQGLDWLRRPQPVVSTLGSLILIAALYVGYSAAEGTLDNATAFPLSWLGGGILLLLVGAATFPLSVAEVNLTRHGERMWRTIRVKAPEALPLPAVKHFLSPRWALLWQFLRKDGLHLPLYVGALGLCLLVGVMVVSAFTPPDSDTIWTLEWAAWLILPFVSVAWSVRHGGVGMQRSVRPSLGAQLYPISTAEQTVVRLWGHGMVLLLTWGVLLLLSNAAFFSAHDGLAWRIVGGSLAAGESSVREILNFRLAVPIVALLAAWGLMVGPTRLFTCGIAVVATPFALNMLYKAVYDQPAPPFFALAFALLIPLVGGGFLWAWKRGLVPRQHLFGCTATWLVTALLVYPIGQTGVSKIEWSSLLLALTAGAVVVLPYPALLLDIHRRRHGEDSPIHEGHAGCTTWKLTPALRIAVWLVLATALGMAGWLHWPAPPRLCRDAARSGQTGDTRRLGELLRADSEK